MAKSTQQSKMNYTPNAHQAKFIQLIAQRYDYLAFGNDHRIPEITAFALNTHIVRLLVEAGKEFYFLEKAPFYQKTIDNISRHAPTDLSVWRVAGLNALFGEAAAENKKMKFVACNQQLSSTLQMLTAIPKQLLGLFFGSIYLNLLETLPKLKIPYNAASGIANLATLGIARGIFRRATDDRKTANFIKMAVNQGVMLYSAGHFMNLWASPEENRTFRLLLNQGSTLCVLDIYKDSKQRNEKCVWDCKKPLKPDGIIYVFPPKNNPSGIEIINPELQRFYDEALSVTSEGPILSF